MRSFLLGVFYLGSGFSLVCKVKRFHFEFVDFILSRYELLLVFFSMPISIRFTYTLFYLGGCRLPVYNIYTFKRGSQAVTGLAGIPMRHW